MQLVATLLAQLRSRSPLRRPAAQRLRRGAGSQSCATVMHSHLQALSDELDAIRRTSLELDRFSWTSQDYQRDLLNFIFYNKSEGAGVIEVGTYKGGLTAQLALVCNKLGWPLWSMDVDSGSASMAAGLLQRVGLADSVNFHLGTLESFAQRVKLTRRPVLVVLDGDHRYEAVVQDIRSLYQLSQRPFAAAFHDYSLRHPTSGERVSDAIVDCFRNVPIRLIGARMEATGPYPTREKPQADGHWWEVPGSEGAIVELPSRLKT